MKGCETQCGNRFHYLLIWPCRTASRQSRGRGAAACTCARLTHFTPDEGLRAGSLDLSHLNSCKFRRRYGWNTLKQFGVYVKDLDICENQNAAWTCRRGASLKGKPAARQAKLLAGCKGQKLVFHFLNGGHNRSTVTLM